MDYDRHKNKNIGKKWIIYDHDYMFNYNDKSVKYYSFFNNIFDNENYFNEMWEILYTL